MNTTTEGATVTGGANSYVLSRIDHTGETQLVSVPEGTSAMSGQKLVVRTRYGEDIATVLGPIEASGAAGGGDSVEPMRVATDAEQRSHELNNQDAADALRACREFVTRHGLDMSLVSAHYVLDRSRLVFFFSADQRVDFRELVKDLVHEFRVRIELRQIGVRDEARLLGGLGICGRVLCCNGVSDNLKAVSIKMAKAQNLSLNSMKISGPCGRLLCCLEYEYDFYRDSIRGLPNVGARVAWADRTYRVSDLNVLTRTIRLESDGESRELPATKIRQGHGKHRWEVIDEQPTATASAAPPVVDPDDAS